MTDTYSAEPAATAPDSLPEAMSAREAGRHVSARRREEQQPAEDLHATADAISREQSTHDPDKPISAREGAAELKGLRERKAAVLAELVVPHTEEAEPEPQVEQQPAAPQLSEAQQAEIEQAQRARQQYEQAAALTLQRAEQTLLAEFSNLKTPADLEALKASDPARYAKFVQTAQLYEATQGQLQQLEARKATEREESFHRIAAREDELFSRANPELKDPATAARVYTEIVGDLERRGLPKDVVQKLWNSEPMFRSAIGQGLLYDAFRYRDLTSKAKAARPTQPAPGQRPGVARGPGAASADNIATLKQKLLNTKGLHAARVGAQLLKAQRAAARR